MEEKARTNLQASRTLLASELVDPAMSRLYYALFQAGVHAMESKGRRPGEFRAGESKWTHGMICGNASLYRRRLEDLALFRDARSLREQADYAAAPVLRVRVEQVLASAEAFFEEVCS